MDRSDIAPTQLWLTDTWNSINPENHQRNQRSLDDHREDLHGALFPCGLHYQGVDSVPDHVRLGQGESVPGTPTSLAITDGTDGIA